MFIYTFHTSDYSYILNYLSDDYILYVCRHYGIDKNNMKINLNHQVSCIYS